VTGVEVLVGPSIGLTTRAAQALYGRRGWEGILAKSVSKKLEFDISKRKLKKLLKTDECRTMLERLDQGRIEQLESMLYPVVAGGRRSQLLPGDVTERAVTLASLLQQEFLRHLDAPYAISLAHERSELRFAEQADRSTVEDPLLRLPPPCRASVAALASADQPTGAQLQQLLLDPMSPTEGVLAAIVENPPDWLQNASYRAWEALYYFASAYDLTGTAEIVRAKAITAGSPLRELFEVHQALAATDAATARDLIVDMPVRSGLVAVASARINEDPAAVLEMLRDGNLELSTSPQLALFGLQMRLWAEIEQGDLELALETSRRARDRYPNRGSLWLQAAELSRVLGQQALIGSAEGDRLLRQSIELAVEARNKHREWYGPSWQGTKAATDILIALDDPEEVLHLTTQRPQGDATDTEANHPEVRSNRAIALLRLQRHEELADLDLAGVSDFDRALLAAMQAHSAGETNAADLMRDALDSASDDPSTMTAQYGLALLGEVDDESLSGLPPEYEPAIELIRAIAIFHTQRYQDVVDRLIPYRFESPNHAHWLAESYTQLHDTPAAVSTLLEASERLGVFSLKESAIQLLMNDDLLDRAESLAMASLVQSPPPRSESRLRRLLVEIANRREDWQTLFTYADALYRQFPEEQEAAWWATSALYWQERRRAAWQYISTNELRPVDEQGAVIDIDLRGSYDSSSEGIDQILSLAHRFPDSERVVGVAIATLQRGGAHGPFSEHQLTHLGDLTTKFFDDHPDSTLLQTITGSDIDDLVSQVKARLAPGAEFRRKLVNQVRHGQMPYGALQIISSLPYAELLLGRKAGALTAVSSIAERRSGEHAIARQALTESVILDTSAAVVCDLISQDPHELVPDLVVPDELLIDARQAVTSLTAPVSGHMDYDPAYEQLVFTDIDTISRENELATAHRIIETLEYQRIVASRQIKWPDAELHHDLAPWDAALRLASDTNSAVWADDLAYRALAESLGIRTFGTYALLEVLTAQSPNQHLPKLPELRAQFINHNLADVPLTFEELTEISATSGYSPIPTGLVLARPASWSDPMKMIQWHNRNLAEALQSNHRPGIADLVFCASVGLGFSRQPHAQRTAMGLILAEALMLTADPTLTSPVLYAARRAWNQLDPSGTLDATAEALTLILEIIEPDLGTEQATRFIAYLFSAAEQEHRLAATSALLGQRS